MQSLLKKTGLLASLLLLSSFGFATTWTAGSQHTGKVTVPIEGGSVINLAA